MDNNSRLIKRIKKIEGQVRALERQLSQNKNCDEIIQQIIAARSALASLGIEIILESNKDCQLGKTKPEELKRYLVNIFKLT